MQKKLSNPATVLRVLKYIPELEKQVKALIQKKEELFSSVSRKLDVVYEERQKKSSAWRSLSAVSASRLNDREVVLQISTFKVQEIPLSHILFDLEEDGFSLLNATSYESFGGRVFYSLHLQVISCSLSMWSWFLSLWIKDFLILDQIWSHICFLLLVYEGRKKSFKE